MKSQHSWASLNINYKSNTSWLCELGKKYDTDKSSQRSNVTDSRHCHPYTLFYDSLFKNKRNDCLNIAEIGILEGSSLRMWQEYFPSSNVYGFEYSDDYINKFKNLYNNDRVTLAKIDVTQSDSIKNSFNSMDKLYDIVIEDTTHHFEDQIRVIENMYQHIKPGGIIIIEDIFKTYNENDYINRLAPILTHFQDYYFVSVDHVNRYSAGWNNDKLFILVKNGAEPIFKNNNKLTIITPSYRTQNLTAVKNSINFDYVDQWIIVYDEKHIHENPKLFQDNHKINEYLHTSDGLHGNPQRNYALSLIKDKNTILYYLDDDNVIHPQLYKLLDIIDNNKLYSFNQTSRLRGDSLIPTTVDTAMVLIDNNLCNGLLWDKHEYGADGYYIQTVYNNNKDKHIFVDNDLCYYNTLR
jgi:SAM-dependent methyltransferase